LDDDNELAGMWKDIENLDKPATSGDVESELSALEMSLFGRCKPPLCQFNCLNFY
jgi:hypothetical protein